jgi:hypothetical protein
MPAMPPEHDVTHRDLWVKLAELSGKFDSMLTLMSERKEVVDRLTKDVNVLFGRQRTLENRMAQVAIIGAVAALLVPVFGNWMQLRLTVPVEHQQVKP